MRSSKFTDEQLIDRIAVVFRQHGYAGASLSALSQATGLERASLYHRFPGGKEEMAQAVLASVGQRLEVELFAPLREPGDVKAKLAIAVKVINEFYRNGHLPCVLETLSLDGATPKLRRALAAAAKAFLDALTALARELGAKTPAQSRKCAAAAMGSIEGALVLTRATGDEVYFRDALAHFPDLLSVH